MKSWEYGGKHKADIRMSTSLVRVGTSFLLETILNIIYLGDGQVPWELVMDFLCLAAYHVPIKLTLIFTM